MMDKRKALVTALILILALAAATLIVSRLGGGSAPGMSGKAYFYDLNTGELFVAPADSLPPIDAPSGALRGTTDGKAGVRAYVFTCGDDVESDRFIGWIETYTPEARQALMQDKRTKTYPLSQTGGASSPLVAGVNPVTPGNVKWMSIDSPAAGELLRRGTTPCPDGMAPSPCRPQ